MRVKSGAAVFIVCAVAAAACGKDKSDSGTNPSGSGGSGSGGTCRTYAATATQNILSSGSQSTLNQACSFSLATNQLTCTFTSAGAPCYTQVTSYAAKGDFVDEVKVIPPTARYTTDVYTNTGACGSPSRTTTNTYDAQSRVIKETDLASGFANSYTAWDSSGRPTVGVNPGPPTANYTFTYNDSSRTTVKTTTLPTGTLNTTSVYDSRGIPTSISTVIVGGATSTVTTTVATTAEVCK